MYGWSVNITGSPKLRAGPVSAVQPRLGALTHGLTTGTKVASNLGWREVDALSVGDDVLTFDNAMQRIVDVRRTVLWADTGGQVPPLHWPVLIPEGALGNRCDLVLLPDQGVLVESDEVCDTHGDPFALVPAQALEGLRGITRTRPSGAIELITLYFDQDEVIYTEGGFLVHCSASQEHAEQTAHQDEQPYQMLPLAEARHLASSLNVDAHVAASRASYVIGATNQVLIA